jgi:hypothetical protein
MIKAYMMQFFTNTLVEGLKIINKGIKDNMSEVSNLDAPTIRRPGFPFSPDDKLSSYNIYSKDNH